MTLSLVGSESRVRQATQRQDGRQRGAATVGDAGASSTQSAPPSGAAARATPTERRHVEPAKARGRTRQTKQRQAKPRQAKRGQDLKQQTVKELREQAREAGIKGRSLMTKDQLIKALRDHR